MKAVKIMRTAKCAGCGLGFVPARKPINRNGEDWHSECWMICTGEVVTRP